MSLDCAILVPFYRSRQWLDRCLESAVAQPVRWILLWDDGSTDGSLAIAQKWAAQDDRVVIQSAPNAGACAARNALLDWALAATDVEWFQYIDADDWIAPGKVERQIALAEPDSEWLYCDQVYLDYSYYPAHAIVRRWLDPHGLGYPPHPGSWLLRRSLFDRLPSLRWDQRFWACRNDLDFWLQGVTLGARTQHTRFVGSFYRAEWGRSQLTNVPAWYELDTIQAKFPAWVVTQRSTYSDQHCGAPPKGRSNYRARYDTPKLPGELPTVLIDVSPWTEPEGDWQRAIAALEALSARDLPCHVAILWPWGEQVARVRSIPVESLELRDYEGDFDCRVATGLEPVAIAPLELFDPPISWSPIGENPTPGTAKDGI